MLLLLLPGDEPPAVCSAYRKGIWGEEEFGWLQVHRRILR